jgi:hypothetical protein
MRPTIRGLLFRTFRMLFILTLIAGGFSAVLSALEGGQTPRKAPAPPGPGGSAAR